MKKLFILLAAVAMTAMSAQVFAQSTGTKPAPGATHEYSIMDNSSIGNTVLWTVTKGDLITPAETDVIITATEAYKTNITWADGLQIGDWYYVHVIETDGNECSNEKVLPVQITASSFNLILAAKNAEKSYDNVVIVTLENPSTPQYYHGETEIEFSVSPIGLSNSYSGYSFDIEIDYGTYSGLSQGIKLSNNATMSGTKILVSDNEPVTIIYSVDNTNLFTNENDIDGIAANYTATITISNGKADNGVSDNTNGFYVDKTSVSRPHTSIIKTN